MPRIKKELGKILIEKGFITAEQLNTALAIQLRTKEFLGAILLKRGWIEERDLLAALSEQFNIPVVGLKDKYIDWNVVKGFSASLILDHGCFPIEKGPDTVTIAINNPLDALALKRCEDEAGGFKVRLALASQEDMKEAVKRYNQYMRGNISRLF